MWTHRWNLSLYTLTIWFHDSSSSTFNVSSSFFFAINSFRLTLSRYNCSCDRIRFYLCEDYEEIWATKNLSSKTHMIDSDNFESSVYESDIVQILTTLIYIIHIEHFCDLFTLCDLVSSFAFLSEVLTALSDARNFYLKFTTSTLIWYCIIVDNN